jgi:putative spermidine/putrescine transport system permease protein
MLSVSDEPRVVHAPGSKTADFKRPLRASITRTRAGLVLLLTWPSIALIGLVVVPFVLLVRISVASPDPSGLWTSDVTLDAYRGLIDRKFGGTLLYSLGLSTVVAAASVGLGLPLTYFITRMSRRRQILWLVFLLVTLSLSDVLIAFSWQVMLSKRGGLSSVLVMLGILDRPQSLAPGNGAVIASLIYLVMPFTILTLYPALSQLAPSLIEASRMLGASPVVAFRTVIIPLTRRSVLAAFLIALVLTLGAYVSPIVLGKPQSWTVAVLIGNAALAGHNVPRAAAMSVSLLGSVLLLGGVAAWTTRAGHRQ